MSDEDSKRTDGEIERNARARACARDAGLYVTRDTYMHIHATKHDANALFRQKGWMTETFWALLVLWARKVYNRQTNIRYLTLHKFSPNYVDTRNNYYRLACSDRTTITDCARNASQAQSGNYNQSRQPSSSRWSGGRINEKLLRTIDIR